jgi:hypothetical protein
MYWRKRNCGICPPPQPDHFTNEQFAGDRHLSGFSARVV